MIPPKKVPEIIDGNNTVGAPDGGISHRLIVDGKTMAMRVTLEALQDQTPSLTHSSRHEQFEAGRSRFMEIAKRKIETGEIDGNIVWVLTTDLAP